MSVVSHDQLAKDAEAIRSLQEKGRGVMFQIAERLAKVQEREGWSHHQLAEWCETEDLGFETRARVIQLLSWRRTVGELLQAGVTAVTPSERSLRPLVQAETQGLLTSDDVVSVYRTLTEDRETSPTADEFEEAVYSHPAVAQEGRRRERQRGERRQEHVQSLRIQPDDPEFYLGECESGLADLFDMMGSVEKLPWDKLEESEFDRLMTHWQEVSASFTTNINDYRR